MSRATRRTRAILRSRKHHCSSSCRGWDVFDRGWTGRELEIERCDECCEGLDITDADCAALPEARHALRRARENVRLRQRLTQAWG